MSKATHQDKKYNWVPLLSFGGGVSTANRIGFDGWLNTAYNVTRTRTLGLRYKNELAAIVAHKVANRSSYDTFDSLVDYTMDIKYDPAKLTSIWYRYRRVNGVLQAFSDMPELRVFSIREHMTDFGFLDLSGNPKFSHLDVSTHFSTEPELGGSIDSISFHVDAPLKFVYLSGCVVPVSVVDACLTKCYDMRDIAAPDGIEETKKFQSQRVAYSPGLQYMVDELVNNYGWTGFGAY